MILRRRHWQSTTMSSRTSVGTPRHSRLPRWFACGFVLVLLLVGGVAWHPWDQRASNPPASVAVTRSTIETSVTALGTLQPHRYVDVGAQVSGQIMHLHAQAGDVVTKGQLLVEIDPSVQQASVDAGRASLKAQKAQLIDQNAQYWLATQRHARLRPLASDGASSLDELQDAQATLTSSGARIQQLQAQITQTQATLKADEARLGYTRIYAPMAGTVVSVDAREGQTLNATYQTPNVLRIADLTSMTVWSEVSEADVGRVKPGMAAYFTTLGNDQRRWESKVRQVLPAPPAAAAGAATGTPSAANKVVVYTVLFDVSNTDAELMPQMTAQVTFVETSAKDALSVPLAALFPVEGSADLFLAQVVKADGNTETRQVRIGTRNRFFAQVLEGLQPGERVVTGSLIQNGAKG